MLIFVDLFSFDYLPTTSRTTQIRENTVRIRMCLNSKALRKVRYLMCNKNGRKKHEKGHETR